MSTDKLVLGAILSPLDIRDYRIACASNASMFPEQFELTQLPEVKNQESVGSCVAHSVSEVVEYYNRHQENDFDLISTAFIYGNRDNSSYKGSGMIVRDAVANTTKLGAVKYAEFPGNLEVPDAINVYQRHKSTLIPKAYPNRFSSYFRCYTVNDIKQTLTKYGPVVFAINWYSDIRVDNISGMITTSCSERYSQGGHCMIIYGWNKDGWLIQNSWGTQWGKSGRAILPYKVPIQEAWGIIDNICYSNDSVEKPFSSKLGNVFAKIINKLAQIWNVLIS